MLMEALASAVLGACPATPLQYDWTREGPRETAPWVSAGPGRRRLVGYLYAYHHMLGDARVRTSRGVVLYAGRETKIGWIPRSWSHGWGRYLVVDGRRLDAFGSFRQRFGRTLAPQFYNSGVSVPSPGCWRLTLRSGTRSVTTVVRAIEPPTEPPCDATPVENRAHPVDPFFRRWIAASPPRSGITAGFSIFVEGVEGAATYTGGRTPEGANTKILWMTDPPASGAIRIIGMRLDGAGSFEQSEQAAGGPTPGVYPSIVVFPSAGCWLLTLRTGGIGGVVVMRAVAP